MQKREKQTYVAASNELDDERSHAFLAVRLLGFAIMTTHFGSKASLLVFLAPDTVVQMILCLLE